VALELGLHCMIRQPSAVSSPTQNHPTPRAQTQPTTTMRILNFGEFDGCTQGGADAAKWLKINLRLRITRIITCFDHKMVSVSIFNNN
jgi:hypothetical protein